MSIVQGQFQSNNAAETEAIGAKVAAALAPGDVVLIEGELGAGKTTFVRGAAVRSASPRPSRARRSRSASAIRRRCRSPTSTSSESRVSPARTLTCWPTTFATDTIAFVEWPQGEEQTVAGFARIAARVRLEHAGGTGGW